MPHPVDAPQQHAAGPDPDRILLLGNGPSIGFGVRTQELALSGHLARALAARTGRGVDLDVVAKRGMTVETVSACLQGLRLWRYDAIVVTLGATDAFALLPPKRWRIAVQALIDELRRASTPSTQLVIVGVTPLQRSAFSVGRVGDIADRHAALLNSVTSQLCAASRNCVYQAPTTTESSPTAESQPSARYAQLGALIAVELSPRLSSMPGRRARRKARALREEALLEGDRQAALDALGVPGAAGGERIDRVTRCARSAFGTQIAAVALLDHDRERHRWILGTTLPELPRTIALGGRAIQQEGPLIIDDLQRDAQTPDAILGMGLRFFAGYPLEAPDGYRIGALCLLDPQPRHMTDTDIEVFRQLALNVQRELWQNGAGTIPTPTHTSRSAASFGSRAS